MSWNYRVLQHAELDLDGDPVLAIHEVYYTDGVPTSYSLEPAVHVGSTIEELEAVKAKFAHALQEPVLNKADFKS